jgi:hypothetical protein
MAWIIGEKFRRSLSVTAENKVYERGWTVWNESAGAIIASEASAVLNALAGTVSIGSTFPGLAGVECVEIRPDSRDDCEVWDVTARYEIPPKPEPPDDFDEFVNQSQNTDSDNPFAPEFSGGGLVMEEYWAEDLDGKPFVNSAKDALQHSPPIPITVQVDRVTVSERGPARTARIGTSSGRRLLADVAYQSAEHVNRTTGLRTRYYKNTYEVWTHPYRDWHMIALLDQGFRARIVNQATGAVKIVNIVDPDTKEPVAQAANLDGEGNVLPEGQKPKVLWFRVRQVGSLGVPFIS